MVRLNVLFLIIIINTVALTGPFTDKVKHHLSLYSYSSQEDIPLLKYYYDTPVYCMMCIDSILQLIAGDINELPLNQVK